MTLPGDPPQPGRPPAPGHADPARDGGHLRRASASTWWRAPRSSSTTTTSPRSTSRPTHPARALQDTFYLSDDVVLRTHTSPMQVRAMELQEPPIYVVVPGRVYRRDSDATHTPMFHQLEGLAIDEDITLGDLERRAARVRARDVRRRSARCRLRSGYFPFTEPSVEVDVSCFNCGGTGYLPDGSRDPLCKGSGWIEILGSGMVDPNVLGFVADKGYDPERVQGFAFGMGIERIAMLQARGARPAHAVRERPAPAGAVRLMQRVPSPGCALLRPRPARRGARRAADDGRARARAASTAWAWATPRLRRRAGARGRAAPGRRPPDASARSTTARASRARSCAARPTWRPARPWRWPGRAR